MIIRGSNEKGFSRISIPVAESCRKNTGCVPGFPGHRCSPAGKNGRFSRLRLDRGESVRIKGVPHVPACTECTGGDSVRYCHHIVIWPAMAGQQECPKLVSVPLILCLCRFVPEKAEKRRNIPPGMPEEIMASAVPRSFRSGRCPSCDLSARADAVRIRASAPIMRVKDARFFRCGAIAVFLVHNSERIYSDVFLYEPCIIVKYCCIPSEKHTLPDSPFVSSLAGSDLPVCILP